MALMTIYSNVFLGFIPIDMVKLRNFTIVGYEVKKKNIVSEHVSFPIEIWCLCY
ncbi:hypothetical protein SAMN03080598_00123 [Algoriphagus boritolerans DSM 17298 = JCM 18970]|uniref:Uncharacterized protein n=1 Tax=Algoriphagus boritolerans DSM 17298 = JCM 18970 TaxID=1120964 RepID=A0A1H5RUI7_9BACT|nr:hypothetical protein SAMN03080598_00123 [Algoriphagus boritolerans DSM 17298 = JCM 18970]